ncbi:hypothetical protein SPRG_12341 [Saprolegnia parasitica CBS 223.65]|uniref:Tyrosinase copper-binding domain-containing protein n=1 Tax=Saprolegnia parasitica (strain CBS 223.65) TaxID=695850 RepID=A0A067C5L8_SAPPC|nr:hypothetical protein SPRG_12341 [Saprolegnia parasitica CBS 223.65]KDO21841.1 hypothetical protein SPRG_12341 [Saprolegnia parasitica CBS 223.65]|eukprot:XP_012207399.1 hypothetical protein SPRG_12341 [Saprolegnia parasitica CBS 223.65]
MVAVPTLLSLALLVSAVSAQSTPSCPPRVRKSWNRYSETEKATYKKARFISMHSEQMSNKEAHGTCVFLFWHRKFLLGYENLLRSMGPEYACVTLPYYDYVQDNVAYGAKKCTSIESCSSILRDMGGSTGVDKSIPIGRYTVAGRCVANEPVNHFCESKASCAKCVPRGPWSTTTFNPDLGFSNIKNQVFGGKDIAATTRLIESTPHNSMHGTLAGAMNNVFISPTEPVFYSHHAMVDALHTIYHKCRVQGLGLSPAQKQVHAMSFAGCSANGGAITATSAITMRAVVNGKTVAVDSEPSVQAFFKGLPSAYYGLVDANDLGSNSYAYEFTGLLGDLYTNCQTSGTPRAATRRLVDGANATTTTTTTVTNTVVPIADNSAAQALLNWRLDVFAAAPRDMADADVEADIVKMRTLYYENCLNGVADYSSSFKALWKVGSSPSTKVLNAVYDQSSPIRIPDWQTINSKHFGCSGEPTK